MIIAASVSFSTILIPPTIPNSICRLSPETFRVTGYGKLGFTIPWDEDAPGKKGRVFARSPLGAFTVQVIGLKKQTRRKERKIADADGVCVYTSILQNIICKSNFFELYRLLSTDRGDENFLVKEEILVFIPIVSLAQNYNSIRAWNDSMMGTGN